MNLHYSQFVHQFSNQTSEVAEQIVKSSSERIFSHSISLQPFMLTHAGVDFCFYYVLPSQMFVNDIDGKNEASASLVDECWQKCSDVIICSGKSILVILKHNRTGIGLLCSSLSENSQELNSQLLIFSKISLLF